MTVIPLFTPGARPGTCDVCAKESGNLNRHRAACARRHGRLPSAVPLSVADERLILRAGTHATHVNLLAPEARLHGKVRDLDIARLVLHVERGGIVVPSATGRTWYAEGMPKLPGQNVSLTRTAQEAVRLGILRIVVRATGRDIYRTQLSAAPTHARSARDRRRPVCGLVDPDVLRWRLLDRAHLAYVDCQGCMDLALSRAAEQY